MAAQKFSLCKGITVPVKEFVLINVNDEDIEEALAVTPVKKMPEILDELLLTVLGAYTVSDIVVPLVRCGGLRDYLIQQDGKYKGSPLRTTAGGSWLNGFSDHLPTVIYLVKEK